MDKTLDNIHQKATQQEPNMQEVHAAIERAGKIAKIHKILTEHESGVNSGGVDESQGNSQKAIDNFTRLHESFNDLEVPPSGKTVDQKKLAAMDKTLDSIYKKVNQTKLDIEDVHTAIQSAHDTQISQTIN